MLDISPAPRLRCREPPPRPAAKMQAMARLGDERRRRLREARLYLVCGAVGDGRDLAGFLDAALRGGVDVIQLREKDGDEAAVLAAAPAFRAAADAHGALFVLNDRPDLVAATRAGGVHVGQDDLSVAQTRALVGPDVLIGRSTHSPAQLDAAAADADVDYFAVGPVHATPTKPGRPAAGLELIRHAASALRPVPWFAIGGIDSETVGAVGAAGATRVVVVRALDRSERPRGDRARAARCAQHAGGRRWRNVAASAGDGRPRTRRGREGPEPHRAAQRGAARAARAARARRAPRRRHRRRDRRRGARGARRRRLRGGRADRRARHARGRAAARGAAARRRRRDVARALLGGARLRGAARLSGDRRRALAPGRVERVGGRAVRRRDRPRRHAVLEARARDGANPDARAEGAVRERVGALPPRPGPLRRPRRDATPEQRRRSWSFSSRRASSTSRGCSARTRRRASSSA